MQGRCDAMKVLGLDFGTTSFGACLYDSEMTTSLFASKKSRSLIINGLRREFDIQKVICDLHSFIKYLGTIFDLEKVEALAVTGNMHSFFLVKDDQIITNIITWEDKRALEEYMKGVSYSDYINSNYKHLFSRFQYSVVPGYAVTTLLNLSKYLNLEGCSIHFAPDFIVKELLGNTIPYISIPTDYSLAHSSGLYLLENKRWNYELINALGYNKIYFPKIAEPCTFIGTVGSHIRQLSGIPIYLGMGDNQASVLGALSYEKKCNRLKSLFSTLIISIGTSGQVSVVAREMENVSKLLDYRPFFSENYLLVGASLSGGKTMDTIKDFIKGIVNFICDKTLTESQVYEFIKSSVSLDSPLKFRTTLEGTRCDPKVRGSISNINSTNFTIQNLVTAAAYGIVEELHEYYEEMNIECENILGVGNGLQKNPFFIDIIKKMFKKDFHFSDLKEAASFGAAICALVGKSKGGLFL